MNNFTEACKLSFLDWELTMPNIDEMPEPEYSRKHIKRINKLFDQMRDDTYHYLTRKAIKTIILAAVLMALLLSAFVIPSSREFLIENFDLFGVFEITEHNNNSVNGEIEVGYIPEGYELVEADIPNKYMIYIYESNDGQRLKITKNASSLKYDINTEDGEIEEIKIDNTTYLYNTNFTKLNNIIWIQHDYVYKVEGYLSKEDLLKIAKTVK